MKWGLYTIWDKITQKNAKIFRAQNDPEAKKIFDEWCDNEAYPPRDFVLQKLGTFKDDRKESVKCLTSFSA